VQTADYDSQMTICCLTIRITVSIFSKYGLRYETIYDAVSKFDFSFYDKERLSEETRIMNETFMNEETSLLKV